MKPTLSKLQKASQEPILRKAVDIRVRGQDALKLIEVALKNGITGLGVKQHGESRFIHLGYS